MPETEGVITIPLRDVIKVSKRGGQTTVTWRNGDESLLATKSDKYPEEFDEFWSVYPTRLGTNSKREAFQAFNARRSEGIPASVLITKASQYASYVRATGKAGTEYVMQAASFLGPKKRGWECEWHVAPVQTPYGIPPLEER